MPELDYLIRLESKEIKAVERQPNGMVKITFHRKTTPALIPMTEDEFRKLSHRFSMFKFQFEVEELRNKHSAEIKRLNSKHRAELKEVRDQRDNYRRKAESLDAAAIHSQQRSIQTLNERISKTRSAIAGLATMLEMDFPDIESEEGVIHRIKGKLEGILQNLETRNLSHRRARGRAQKREA